MLPAIILAGVLVYANTLSSPFILDDEDVVVRNPHITSLAPLSNVLSAPAQSSLSGRSLVSISMAISYAMGGLQPAAYHAWNIAVLIATALALFGVVRRTAMPSAIRKTPLTLTFTPD